MRLISWNVNGIRAVEKRGDLKWLFELDRDIDSDVDVVCLQETKIHESQLTPSLTAPPGWKSAWCCGEKKGYSGTATFVREGSKLDVLSRGLDDPTQPHLDSEGRVLCTDHGSFVLFNIYFPNGGRGPERLQYKMEFYAAFAKRTAELVQSGRDVVVCGDWNVAHKDIDVAYPERWANISGFLPEERAWFDGYLKSGFIDTFRAEHGDRPRQFTWWDVRTNARPDNIGWRIDYVVINQRLEDKLVDAWISPQITGSDHCPVGVELDVPLAREAQAAPKDAEGVDDDVEQIESDDDDDTDAPAWRR